MGMNEEVKFKALDSNGELIKPTFNHVLLMSMDSNTVYQIDHEDRIYKEFRDVTFLQYTGIDDKYGNEIYKSDLLAFDAEAYGTDKYYVFEVTQSEAGEWIGAGLSSEWSNYCTKVGTKYENCELLEQ